MYHPVCDIEGSHADRLRNYAQLGCIALWKEKIFEIEMKLKSVIGK